ncbi:MAG: methylene-tetrahydromethanopterin dehydrogenase N-terminal domain-containing protein [Pseudomonadota bacterium]|nr:methylene-tetrahydromethanopterin dehydrogenase N-terminal domain-containing protein [Pseudomonadota bacterium]
MKKLLFQLDTDPTPNILDTVIAYDGGADHVLSYGNIKPSTVGIIIDSAIFTCPPKNEEKHGAVRVGQQHSRRRSRACFSA